VGQFGQQPWDVMGWTKHQDGEDQNMISWMEQRDGVVQDRCPDIMQASSGCIVVVLTEIRAEVRQALVVVRGNVDSEGEAD